MKRALLLLIALLASVAFAQRDAPPSDAAPTATKWSAERLARIEQDVQTARDPKVAAEAIPPGLFESPALKTTLRQMRRGDTYARSTALTTLAAFRVAAEAAPDGSALAKVQAIKQGPEYRTPKSGTASNWFGRTLEGFTRWIGNMIRKMMGKGPNVGTPDMPNFSLPGWLIYVVWALLLGVVLLAALPLIRLIRFRIARRQRKARGILEEEPERTKSEYLVLGDELAAQGDYRGAIRMRYLAALKRFDEARVARFDRGETNWEHLARIRVAPTLPAGLDFRPATAAFDHYWYGNRPALRPDYERFVDWYDEVDRTLRQAVAA